MFVECLTKEIKITKLDKLRAMETMKHIEAYQELFDHMSNEHGLTLLESEMQEIIRLSLLTVDNYNKATREGQKEQESTEALHKHFVSKAKRGEKNFINKLNI